MDRSGRIPCINPSCHRTAPAAKYEPGTEIVCGKCWRLLPARLRHRYRQLKRLIRKIERLAAKPRYGHRIAQLDRIADRVDVAVGLNWREIHLFFVAPQMPAGLETFLEEMGMS